MSSRLLKLFVLLSAIFLMSGCKLAVMVAEGGMVTSTSLGNCAEGNNCLIDIVDPNFSEHFTAVAMPGYVFTKWGTGGGFICADSTSTTCAVSIGGGPLGYSIVSSFEARGYIMPIFEFVGIDTDGDGTKDHLDPDDDNDGVYDVSDTCPLLAPNESGNGCRGNSVTDAVFVGGAFWAQPAQFTGLSWNDINVVCPAPSGLCSGSLNGFSLSGWTWASMDEVASLFSYYIDGDSALDGDPFSPNTAVSSLSEVDSSWAPAFFDDFAPTDVYSGPSISSEEIRAITRTRMGSYPDPGQAFRTTISDTSNFDTAGIGGGTDVAQTEGPYNCCGAWFYRTP